MIVPEKNYQKRVSYDTYNVLRHSKIIQKLFWTVTLLLKTIKITQERTYTIMSII
jgi:hypothetical protein